MSTSVPAVVIRGVRLAYDRDPVVHDLDLHVSPGELVALLGPSGSGKTTLLSAVAGFLPVTAGEIHLDGTLVSSSRRHVPPERRSVGFVFQGHALWPHLSALEIVAYPIERRGVRRADARREAAAVLERLGIGRLAARRPAELSGGEQQRVGLGRALARGARVLLFDEPTANLDAALRARLQEEIAEQRGGSRAAAMYATHDTAEALAIADRVALLRDGRLVQAGRPAEVYEEPIDLWAARLTGPAAVLEVTVLEAGRGRAIVSIGGHRVPGVQAAGAVAAGSARALVRPDWAMLRGATADATDGEPGEPAAGELRGRIEAIAYRGPHTDYRVATPAGAVGIREAGVPRVTVGAEVAWCLERAWLLRAGGDDLEER